MNLQRTQAQFDAVKCHRPRTSQQAHKSSQTGLPTRRKDFDGSAKKYVFQDVTFPPWKQLVATPFTRFFGM